MTTVKTTCIGSLPHHNIDAALAFSFQTDIPFLPQIPIRNPWEYMLAQAMEGLPGLKPAEDGAVTLDSDLWHGRTHALSERLEAVFSGKGSYESFEPSQTNSSSWQPFLFELQERGSRAAKVQIAGPLTCQWTLRLSDGASIDRYPDISTQIFQLVLARSVAMVRRIRSLGIAATIYIDEPGLYVFSGKSPHHVVAFQQLRLMIQTLKKEGTTVGLHCCSNTDWKAVLTLPMDYLSIDTGLSLSGVLKETEAFNEYIAQGGRLSLGVISTSDSGHAGPSKPGVIFEKLLKPFGQVKPEMARKILREAIYTPACGLALHGTAEAESILASLLEFRNFCQEAL